MKLWLLILGISWLVSGFAQAQDECVGLVATRLSPGMTARIAVDDGVGLVLRAAPQGGFIQNLPEGTIFVLTDDTPTCRNGFLWRAVQLPDGTSGYLAEGGTHYYTEPWLLGVHLYQPDPANPNQINHLFIDSHAVAQPQPFLNLVPITGTAEQLWQPTEIQAANLVFTDRLVNCPQALPEVLTTVGNIPQIYYNEIGGERAFYPAPNGERGLVIRDYGLDIPACNGDNLEHFGTSYVTLLSAAGEQTIFPFSQHTDPPLSSFCQPPIGIHLEQKTLVTQVAWSPDSQYVGLVVRYLRNSPQFPCAFYHVFIINTSTPEVFYGGEGRRIAWGSEGLYYLRDERGDPNIIGTERLLQVTPDGSQITIFSLPENTTWLPDAADLRSTMLPWNGATNQLLGCAGRDYNCRTFHLYHLQDSRMVSLPSPDPVQLGTNLKAVYFVADDTQLLWLTSVGRIFLQRIADGSWEALVGPNNIIQLIPLPLGIGAILQTAEGRWFYLNILDGHIQPITGMEG
jgi:hypothetical protein